jgi:glycosyltransferase involved in cell wall biosynthesis
MQRLSQSVWTDCVAFGTVGAIISPSSLLSLLYEQHIREGNQATLVHGLPPACSFEIYDTYVLTALQEISLSEGIPVRDLRTLLKQLASWQVQESVGNIRLPLKLGILDALQTFNIDANEMPTDPLMLSSREIGILAQISKQIELPSALGALRMWHELERAEHFAVAHRLKANPFWGARKRTEQSAKRVIYVSNPSGFTGAEQSLCSLVATLDRRRYEPLALIALEGVLARKLRQVGAQVTCAGFDLADSSAETHLGVLEILANLQPDLIHVNAPSGSAILSAAVSLGIPIVSHVRMRPLHTLYAELIHYSDAVICISDFIERELERVFGSLPSAEMVYNGVDTDFFRPGPIDFASARHRIGIPEDGRIVLFIARFAPEKRHDLMLRAFASAYASLPDLRLVMVGEDAGAGVLQEVMFQAEAFGIDSRSHFIGFQEDIRMCYQVSSVVVNCSDAEPLGRSIIEAMAMTLPVVITRGGGAQEIVTDGMTGLVVPTGSPEDISRALTSILDDHHLAERLGRTARRHVIDNLSPSKSVERVMCIYDRIRRPTVDTPHHERVEDSHT